MTNLTNDLIRRALTIYDGIVADVVSRTDRYIVATKKVDDLIGFMLDSFPRCAKDASDANWEEDFNAVKKVLIGEPNDTSETYEENLARKLRDIPPSINPNVLVIAFLRDLFYSRRVRVNVKEMTNFSRLVDGYKGVLLTQQ